MAKNRQQLILLPAAACIAIMAAGWFLPLSPPRAKAAELPDSQVQQEAPNDSLRAQITSVQAIAAKLPQQQAEVEKLLQRVPSQAELPNLIRQLNQAASSANVKVTVFTPQKPIDLPSATGLQGVDLAITVE